MRFDLRILELGQMREGKARLHAIGAGVALHRIHPSRFGSTRFNDTDRGDAGFSPIREPDGSIVPTIYGEQDCRPRTGEAMI